jgi:hypothetical protein
MNNKQLAFYVEKELSIIDTLSNKTGRGTCSNETIEEVIKRYPNAEIVPFDYAINCIEEAAKEKFNLLNPVEITEGQYYEMLECLPPEQYKSTEEGTSFKISERTFGNITACFVHKNSKYYEVMARTHTKHEELLAVCR